MITIWQKVQKYLLPYHQNNTVQLHPVYKIDEAQMSQTVFCFINPGDLKNDDKLTVV